MQPALLPEQQAGITVTLMSLALPKETGSENLNWHGGHTARRVVERVLQDLFNVRVQTLKLYSVNVYYFVLANGGKAQPKGGWSYPWPGGLGFDKKAG